MSDNPELSYYQSVVDDLRVSNERFHEELNTLKEEEIKQIVKLEIDKLTNRLKGLNYNISCDEKVLELISKVGFDETYGARPIKRAIQDKIEDFISEEVLNGKIIENEEFVLTIEEEKIIFKDKEVKKTKKKKGTE